jgi:ribose transport system permease protein
MTTPRVPVTRVSMSTWILTPERRKVIFAVVALALLLAVAAAVKPSFVSGASLTTILMLASFAGYTATGQMLVVLTGGIDLSIPWVLNSAAVVLVVVSAGRNDHALAGVLVALALATLIGLLNGAGVAYLGISAVVMTLGMNGLIEGLTLGSTGGLTCGRCTAGTPEVVQRSVVGELAGMPRGILLWAGVSVLVLLLLSFTTYGRRVYATGTNATAGRLAGINTKLVTMSLYGLSGLFAGLAGITLAAYGGSARLGLGDPYLLQSVAIVVVGGVSMLGGRGLFSGVFVAAITLTAMLALLQAFNLPQYGREIIYGVILIAVLAAYGRERAVT